jgi:5'-nucleotidase
MEADKKVWQPLTIIHYNDVYELRGTTAELCGGADRFVALVREFKKKEEVLVLFSGDLWNPSKLGVTKKGTQMVSVVNMVETKAACIGNHDLDLGEDQAKFLIDKCAFPWLLTNVKHIDGEPLANTLDYTIIETQGHRIGVIGLAESEWVATLSHFDPEDLDFQNPIEIGEEWGKKLKEEHKCDFVIALTHMRVPNDRLLSQNTTTIDLFLGGHDHIYHHELNKDNLFIKSSSDFKGLSLIRIEERLLTEEEKTKVPTVVINDKNVVTYQEYFYQVKQRFAVSIKKYDIVKSIVPDPEVVAHIEDCYKDLDRELSHIVCHLDADLDTTFEKVRTRETAIGNFLADLMRKEFGADCAMIHGGSIRADKVFKNGFMTLGDWNEIIPFQVSIVLLEATGRQIIGCLENGVSKLPALEGRFIQVSNMKFSFDTTRPEGARVLQETVIIDGAPVDLDKIYKVAVPNYLSWGKDGFTSLIETKKIVDYLLGPELKDIVTEFLDFTKGLQTQKEIELYQKHPDLLPVEKLVQMTSKKRKNLDLIIEQSKISMAPWSKKSSGAQVSKEGILEQIAHQVSKIGNKISEDKSKSTPSDPDRNTLGVKQSEDHRRNSIEAKSGELQADGNSSTKVAAADLSSGNSSQIGSFEEIPVLLPLRKTHSSISKLNEDNFASIRNFLEGHDVDLGVTLLKRLRKYNLISSTVRHNGEIIVGISPRIENRITQIA